MKVAVSFISSNYDLETTIKKIDESKADYIHVDMMDGVFVENSNFTVQDLKKMFKDTVKPLSHNPSFKKDKKHNNFDNKSNFSDGYNEFHINGKNNLLHINHNCSEGEKKENCQKTCLNNKAKELEIKHLKELTLRKNAIDKILKEQEDDVD